MGWRKHFTAVDNSGLPLNVQPTSDTNANGFGTSQMSSWLPEVYAGSFNRLLRYQQYDSMDADPEINVALDTIAEFGTQEDDFSGLPFTIHFEEDPSDTESKILSKTLKQWCKLNDMYKRVFKIFRNTTKYGDQIFIRDPETYELYWIDVANVTQVLVNESEGKKKEVYYIKDLEPIFEEKVATDVSTIHGRAGSTGAAMTGGMMSQGGGLGGGFASNGGGTEEGVPVSAEHIVHISLTEGMDNSWPFGLSVLDPIFKVFKQKELLEDSILIYRVHRAPERRVFIVDVGNMPPHKARQYLEQVKYEVQQKRIPGKNNNGQSVADSAYNPMSMLEDYFFAQTADGRGSKVDTLPGGENLGEIDDLKYFNNKLLRGLRVPSSYLPTGPEDGTATVNDGKVGIAYIQEYRFSKFVQRLQKQIQEDLDNEFKMFLKWRGIDIDSGTFYIEFTPPMNFSSFREIQLDAERAGLFAQVQGVPFLANQFKLEKYLGLTDEEIKRNEELWRQENDVEQYQGAAGEATEAGLGEMGMRPESDEAVDLEAEPDLSGLEEPGAEMGGEVPGAEMPAGPPEGGL